MGKPLLQIVLRLLLGSAATYLMWTKLGTVAFAICAPLFGVLLARPIIDLVAAGHHAGRAAALKSVQGRFYEHHGNRFDIAEDDDDARWLLAADVRKIVTGLPRDEVLQRQYPGGAGPLGDDKRVRIRADSLVDYLRKASDPASVRFKVWLEREVLFPSRKR